MSWAINYAERGQCHLFYRFFYSEASLRKDFYVSIFCFFQAPEMLSKPTFEVDLIKPGGKTLSFTCSYVQEDEHPEGQEPDEEGKQTDAH